jgi:two-component system response regulator RegA
MPKGSAILLVDDEELFRERLVKAFDKRGFSVSQACDYDEALLMIEQYRPDMAVVDLKMPGKSGLEVVRDGLAIHGEMKIIVLTGYGSIATAIEAIRLGAHSYLSKPVDVGAILSAFAQSVKAEGVAEVKDFTPPSLARTEWEHINRVLSDCAGNISETAKRLGIHRRTLQRKLDKFPPKI